MQEKHSLSDLHAKIEILKGSGDAIMYAIYGVWLHFWLKPRSY